MTAEVTNPPSTYPYTIHFLKNGDIEHPITINSDAEESGSYVHNETFQQYNHAYEVRIVNKDGGIIASSNTENLTVYQQATVTVNQAQPIVLSKSASRIALASRLSITHATGVTPAFSTTFSGTGEK